MYLDSDIRLSLAAEAAALEAHAVMLGEAIEMLDGDIRAASERLARLRGPAHTGPDDTAPVDPRDRLP
ncbi:MULTISPECIES: hypothetical protein [unclassified Streptomyces]|uniref:hypothetical protein n=1 Tax=unclassified Streptomyces TaxID=2593676 RepID=UPI00332C4129